MMPSDFKILSHLNSGYLHLKLVGDFESKIRRYSHAGKRLTVITVDVNDSMNEAMKRLREHDIAMLPVMKKSQLVGIVTDRDLKRASASDAATLEVHELLYLVSKIKVKDIMTKNPITVPFDFTVEEAAEVFMKNKISGAPVVDEAGNGISLKGDRNPVMGGAAKKGGRRVPRQRETDALG